MKVRKTTSSGDDKIEIQMTPMIDIVFQLLVFFIMTFKIVSMEGDFNIKMPLAAPRQGPPDEDQLPPRTLKMRAGAGGQLASMTMGDRQFSKMSDLRTYIVAEVFGNNPGDDSVRESTEIELDCDYNLRYEHVIQAITAVSGYVQDDTVVKLVEKIKFKPQKGG